MHPHGPRLAGERFVQRCAELGWHAILAVAGVVAAVLVMALLAYGARLGWDAGAP